MILAGGLGTRLRSVVSEVPKCMAPVAMNPFLYYLLQYISYYNVDRVVLSVGYLREKIYEWIDSCKDKFPFEIIYAVEEQPLGTGGGIRLALEKCASESVAILNGDTFFDVDLDVISKLHSASDRLLSVALKPMTHFSRYGNVELLPNGTIAAFKEKCQCERGYINGGVYMTNRTEMLSLLNGLPEKFSFETEVLQPQAANGVLQGVVCNGYFIDIGIPEDYERAGREFSVASGRIDLTSYEGRGDTLFLDRDGVINRLRPNDYVKSIDEFEFLPGVLHALAEWRQYFKRVVIVTNQRGVGKGVMSEASLNEVHNYMKTIMQEHGCPIDAIYYCTAVSDADHNRKPNPGMVEMAVKQFPDIDLSNSLMIGDSDSDRKFAENAEIASFICV